MMTTEKDHSFWMAKAIALAKKGLFTTRENPRVGCVIINNGVKVGEGFHAYPGEAHAEINAIKNAKSHNLNGSCFYITLEPCAHIGKTPPCVDALIAAQAKQVVIAMQDPNPLVAGKSIEKLKQHGIDVIVGILEADAFALNPGFIKRMSCELPFVRLKMAMSLDAKTALKNGQSQWISGKESRHDVQFLRAQSCAILTGINTIITDDPSLNVRLPMQELGLNQPISQPVRVILDSRLRCPLDAKLFSLEGEVWIFTNSNDAYKAQQLEVKGCRVFIIEQESQFLDLKKVMTQLALSGINEVHTECGSGVAGSLLKAELVDEMVIYMAPKFLGTDAQGLLDLGELTQMDQALSVDIQHIEKLGQDIKMQLKPLYH